MTPRVSRLASKARGAFLGAAVGDALGWPQEQNSGIVGGNRNRSVDPAARFRDWDRYSGSQYQKYIEEVRAGEYSDDTQLILAAARAVLTDDWSAALTRTELPLFLLYQRGAGGATLRACRSWASGVPPWIGGATQKAQTVQQKYFSAGGNGVAMRILPHVIVSAASEKPDLVERTIRDGITTHGHPRALVGAAVYASAMHSLLTFDGTLEYGELAAQVESDVSWQLPEIAFNALPDEWIDAAAKLQPDLIAWWRTAVDETKMLLSRTATGMKSGLLGNDLDVLEALGCFDKRANGSGTITAVGAIFLASRYAPRPQSGLLRAAFLERADTDTLASMTAGLLGALHGPKWLDPLSFQVQDHEYITHLADRCTDLALGQMNSDSDAQLPVGESDLRSFRNHLAQNGPPTNTFPGGRRVLSKQRAALQARANGRAIRWILDVEGQTVVVDLVGRILEEESQVTLPLDSDADSAKLLRLSVLVPDCDAIEAFYGPRGLGLQVDRPGTREVVVDGRLRFVQPTSSFEPPKIGVHLEIEVTDVRLALRRMHMDPEIDPNGVHLRDPAGNDIDLVQRPT